MLTELSLRSLPIVILLAFFPAAAQAKGGAVSIGQSNPGTIDINRTMDPQSLVSKIGATTIPTTMAGPISAIGTVSSPLQPNSGANGLPLTATASGVPAVAP